MSGPAWARGHDLALLKSLASPFASRCKPFCNGAFGCPKETDIADALEKGEAIYTRSCSDEIAAIALFRVLRATSTHRDFAGREIRMRPGDLFIRAIAGDMEARDKLIDALVERSDAPAIFLEDWVESPDSSQWCRSAFERAATKIAASSDIKGLWLLGEDDGRLPAPLDPADAVGLCELETAWTRPGEIEAILAEIAAFAAGTDPWAQHYSNYNKRQSWTAFALRGFDPGDPGFIIKPAEMSRAWKAEHPERMSAICADTIAAAAFPAAMAVVARIPAPVQRIRLMRLAAGGGELTRHADIVDPEAGTGDGQSARFHIPLISPPECRFSSWQLSGERLDRHLPEGSLCYLDTRKPHAVINPGGKDRIHLVIDVLCNSAIRAMIEAAA